MSSNIAYLLVASGLGLHSQAEIDANNLANSQTVGFEADTLIYVPYDVRESKKRSLTFALDQGTSRDLTMGDLQPTHKPLDLAISGEGYFGIDTPHGLQLTKAGNFTLDEEGFIITPQGYHLLSRDNQPIAIPANATEITVGKNGMMITSEGEVGQVGVFNVSEPRRLVKVGKNLLRSSEEVPEPVEEEKFNMLQGFLQQSNTSSILQTTKMMETSRAYEMNASLIQASHRLRKDAVGKLMTDK